MRKLPLHTVTYWRQSVAHPPRLQSSIVSCSPLECDCRPRADELCNRTREGPVFFLCRFLSGPSQTFDAAVFFCAVADCGLARAPKPIYVIRVQNKLGKNTMA